MISLIYFYFLNKVAVHILARTVPPLVRLFCPLQNISLPAPLCKGQEQPPLGLHGSSMLAPWPWGPVS